MDASTAAHGQCPVPPPQAWVSEDAAHGFARQSCSGRIREIITEAGLTVVRLSAITRQSYGQNSQYFIPPTFLFKLNRGISPHVCQLAALSAVTGHSFADCMSICSFDLRLIFPAQLQLHTERTVLVTPGVAKLASEFPGFSSGSEFSASIPRYLFARIGRSDASASRRLVSGSVVRVDRYSAHLFHGNSEASGALWLVEHTEGLTCCHVKRVGSEHVVLLPRRPPFSAWPLRLQSEARILGLVDAQVHPENEVNPLPAECCEKFRASPPWAKGTTVMSFSRLLRLSRSRAGLTLRASRAMTIAVAQLLGNPEHRIALGLLSDYEASDKLPRHIAKIMTLCIIYCIDFWELLRTNGSGESACGRSLLPAGVGPRSSQSSPLEITHRWG